MSKSKVDKYVISQTHDQRQRIDENLWLLDLEGMRGCYEKLGESNIDSHGTPLDFLEVLLEKQIAWKEDKRLRSWRQQARFSEEKTLEGFDFSYQPKLDERLIRELASGRFITEGRNIFFFGQPGTGKTHLAKSLGYAVIEQGYDVRFVELKYFIPEFIEKAIDPATQRNILKSLTNPKLLILDDIREEKIPKELKSFLYRLICARYEKKKSIIFTSNQTFDEWGKLFGEYANAIADRIFQISKVIVIDGNSYRIPREN